MTSPIIAPTAEASSGSNAAAPVANGQRPPSLEGESRANRDAGATYYLVEARVAGSEWTKWDESRTAGDAAVEIAEAKRLYPSFTFRTRRVSL